MEEEKIIKLLKFILKTENGRVKANILRKKFTRAEIDFCRTCEFIEYDSQNQNYFLLDNGFDFLNQHNISKNTEKLKIIMGGFKEASDENNKNMESHAKTMKILTWFILGVTIANFISILIQIDLNKDYSKEQIALMGDLIRYMNKTVEQGETQIVLTGEVVSDTEEIKKSLDEITGEQIDIKGEIISGLPVESVRVSYIWIILLIILISIIIILRVKLKKK